MPKKAPGAGPPARTREVAGDPTEPQDDPWEEELAQAADVPEDEVLTVLDEAQSEDNFFAVWYGPPGSTKTTSITRILLARPEGKLVVCNAEAGLKVRALRSWGVPTDRIVVWPRPGVRPTFDGLERLVLKIEAEMAEARRLGQPQPYCAFAIDSVTELVKLMLDNILEDGIAGQREVDRRARAAGVNPPKRNARTRFATQRDDYGLVANQMRAILRKLRYLPLDFLVTALVRRDEDQDTGVTMYGPAAPPALQQDLLGYADIIIRTERREGAKGGEQVVGYTLADQNHHGKDRYGLLPAELLPPGADAVLGYITGAVVDSSGSSPAGAPETDTAAPAETTEADAPAPTEEEPAKKPVRRTRAGGKTAAASAGRRGRIDVNSMKAVGPGDGTDEEPPF